eukprot:scaffold5159_cov112-Cylindrotheca_fusiformis.AAC.9
MKNFLSSLAIILLHSASAQNSTGSNSTNTTETESECPCLFDGDDADDCIVYGALDGELKAWPKADQDCLDAYSIKIDAPDPTLTCSSANSFVNALKNGALSSSSAKFGLGIPFGGFFDESTTNADIPVLKDSITIDGTTYDCSTSESDCYNAMKPYFASDSAGQKEMEDVCDTLEGNVRVAQETAQSVLRTRICQESRDTADGNIPSACSEMHEEMKPELATYSTMNCGGFGAGPGTRELPACGEGSSASTITAANGGSLACGLVLIMSGLFMSFASY